MLNNLYIYICNILKLQTVTLIEIIKMVIKLK